MDIYQRQLVWLKLFLCSGLMLFPSALRASFIESTIGTAVVNDATAAYYNPAALTLLEQPQIIGLGSAADLETNFTGQATQSSTGFVQSGTSKTQAKYYLPSAYLGIPTKHGVTFGVAMISNSFNNNFDDNSVLRYAKANNSTENFEVTPAIGIKLNKFISVGAAISFSQVRMVSEPISGLPSLNIPDSQSTNDATANGLGGDVGILLTPSRKTLIGINYRSAVTYQFNGSSTVTPEGNPTFTSNDYHYDYWTPGRYVLTIAHFVTPKLGLVTTVQRVQWSKFNEVHIQGIATSIGPQVIVTDADVPYHFHDAWLLTVGSQYHITPKWVIRAATSYDQSPGNNQYQIVNGDGIVLGASTGYKFSKHFAVDGSYAHEFLKNENINITSGKNNVTGVNTGFRNAVSLKLTVNI